MQETAPVQGHFLQQLFPLGMKYRIFNCIIGEIQIILGDETDQRVLSR